MHAERPDEPSRGSDLTLLWEGLAACDGDLEAVYDQVARWVASSLGEGAVLTILSEDGSHLRPVAAYHPDPDVRSLMREVLGQGEFRVGEGIVGSVAADRRPAVVGGIPPEVVAEVVQPASRPFAERHPIRGVAVVPMVDRGELVGTLGAVRLDCPDPYDDTEVRALEAVAERAAIAIGDARGIVRPLGPEELEAIYRYSPDGVLFTVPDGRVLAANPAACRVLQLSEAEICRRGRAGLLVHEDLSTRRAIEERARAGVVRAEIPMRRGNGDLFVADMTSAIFPAGDGERSVVIFRDVTAQVVRRDQLQREADELALQSAHDLLTGLRNRRGFDLAATEALEIADRTSTPAQLAYFDLDGLKSVNDTLGHRAGDALLRRFADALQAATRDADVSARIGGDEFVLLLFGADRADAEEVVHRIEDAFEQTSGEPGGSFSVGLAGHGPGSGHSLERLLDRADAAMYEAKFRRRFGRSGHT
jgi:diguanylate cyclase (GGDEF)-like protein/PAS domain S-box-containing protein